MGDGGFEEVGFSPACDVEVDPELPADGDGDPLVLAVDRDGRPCTEPVTRWGAPRTVRVQPWDGQARVGIFSAGGLGGIDGVFATPSPERLCVVVDGAA